MLVNGSDHVPLADAVCAAEGLHIHMGVPVAVVDHYGVRRGEVDAQPTCHVRLRPARTTVTRVTHGMINTLMQLTYLLEY
jgi:hypothetical protein